MDRQTEYELIDQAQAGNEQAKLALIDQHTRALWKMARSTRARGETLEDLYQWAVLFFLEAVQKFKAVFNVRLSTFSYQHVRQRVYGVAWRSGVIHLPNQAKKTDAGKCDLAMRLSGITDGNFKFVERHLSCPPPVALEDGEERALFYAALARLPNRLRHVLELRLSGLTLGAVGDELGVSKERVRQIENEGIQRLRLILGVC
jgi:RNA polymerase sigma factor (sigma-70 family)